MAKRKGSNDNRFINVAAKELTRKKNTHKIIVDQQLARRAAIEAATQRALNQKKQKNRRMRKHASEHQHAMHTQNNPTTTATTTAATAQITQKTSHLGVMSTNMTINQIYLIALSLMAINNKVTVNTLNTLNKKLQKKVLNTAIEAGNDHVLKPSPKIKPVTNTMKLDVSRLHDPEYGEEVYKKMRQPALAL